MPCFGMVLLDLLRTRGRRVEKFPRMPSSTLIPFLGGLGSLMNPFKQRRAPFLSLGYWAA